MTDTHDDLGDHERVVDALLDEHFGRSRAPDLRAAIAAHGNRTADAARAVDRAAAAGAATPSRWLAVAAALLGLFGVFAALRWRDELRPAPVVTPQDPAPPALVPVDSLDRLRDLLPLVKTIEVEVLQLTGEPFAVDVRGAPVQFSEPESLATALAEVRVVEPAGWDWPNRVDLLLHDGRRIQMAVDTASDFDWPTSVDLGPTPAVARARKGNLRLGLRGLQGDLQLLGAGADWFRTALAAARKSAQIRHGIVLGPTDLDGPTALPATAATLRLFGIAGDDLRRLANFKALRRLDLAGLRTTLTPKDLTLIGRLAPLQDSLHELRLDGCQVTDLDLVAILPLVHLRRLELRGGRFGTETPWFTGAGFRHYTNSARMRDGPIAVDLGDSNLTDEGLAAIAQWSPRELRLDGAGSHITVTGWRSLRAARQLTHLDLSQWPLDQERLRDLATRPDLEVLVLRDCGLDDAGAAILQGTAAKLRELDLTGNTTITAKALAALRAALPATKIAP